MSTLHKDNNARFHTAHSAVVLVMLFVGFCALIPKDVLAERLWSSGCELQSDAPGNQTDSFEFWTVTGSSANTTQISSTVKHSGNSSCKSYQSSTGWSQWSHYYNSLPGYGSHTVRFYLYVEQMPAHDASVAVVAPHTLVLRPDGTLRVLDSDGSTVVGTSLTSLSSGQWYRIEWNLDSSSFSSATTEVRIDGLSVITGSVTRTTHGSLSLGLCFTSLTSICNNDAKTTGILYFDDIAINDATYATGQTGWPGEGSIVYLRPNGSGDVNNCSSGGYDRIDEITPDGSSTYCTLVSNNNTLDVNLESGASAGIGASDTITLIQVGVQEAAASNSSGNESWQVRLKSASGGTTLDGFLGGPTSNQTYTTHNDTTFLVNGDNTPRNYQIVSYTDPTTGLPWTLAGTNSIENMQIGIKAIDAAPDIRVSALWALVEYIPAGGGGGGDECASGSQTGFQESGGGPRVAQNAGLFLTTGLIPQEKGACETGVAGLGLGADFFTAVSQLCLGPSNCIADWWPTLVQPSSCQLEVRRVWGSTDTFGANLDTQLCDAKLTAGAVTAGWVATGMDYCDGGLCDASSVSGCVYTRMVCSGGVSASLPTKTGPSAHPLSGFTFTPQCNDGLDNDGVGGVDFPADSSCEGYWDNSE